MKRSLWILSAVLLLSVVSCSKGPEYPGYTLLSKEFVKEVNADCFYFEHDKTGARVFKIAADDPNKTFTIGFKTITSTDCGIPHILEHSVLEGSKNFPVRSPFMQMAKGSLQTFLNAFTAKDMTLYPVASMNEKDYFNLMHVYLDAVFNPLLKERPSTLLQEGWHYELQDADDPLVYKGVVYNEMKGAFSSPEREMYYQTNRNLFPDNCYAFSSGGRPEAIRTLSYEQFLAFYEKHYHPSNSYIYLYGDTDLGSELAFIDSAYLSSYERQVMDLSIPMHEPFEAMKELTMPYPVPEGAPVEDQAMISMSFVVGDGSDMELQMAMDLLTEALVNQESAPLRLALQESGLGQDIHAGTNDLRQFVFDLTVYNTNSGDKNAIRELVFSTLNKVVEEGLDKEAVEGILNRQEFRLREGDDAHKGITYMDQILNSWMYVGDPFKGLKYEAPIGAIKESLTSDYLEQLISDKLINNPHSLMLVLEPEPGMEARISKMEEAELKAHKASLNQEEIEAIIQTTEELLAYQNSEDPPEALAAIPKLSLEDVNPESEWFELSEDQVEGQKVLFYETFTNGVLYTNFMFDMRVAETGMIPFMALLPELLGSMDTENYSYDDLEKQLNIHTGGFSSSTVAYSDYNEADAFVPEFKVYVKAMNDKSDKLLELVEEVLLRTNFSDTARLRNILNQTLSRVESDVKGNGLMYAYHRMNSYHSTYGVFNEMINGMSFYWFLKELMEDFPERAVELAETLDELSGILFTADNLVLGITCLDEEYTALKDGISQFSSALGKQPQVLLDWDFAPEVKNEGLMAASKVQYVLQGGNFKKLGYEMNGHLMVLSSILNLDWLYEELRVKGGAYGGFGGFGENGMVYFGSYRDPNLAETLETYAAIPEFMAGLETDQEDLNQFIIGTIGEMDYPLTPSQKGNVAVNNYFSNKTSTVEEKLRSEVLSTSLSDIKALEPIMKDVLDQNIYCVYGNQDKLRQNSELFQELLTLEGR